jgi:pSer/pThr/pTyr-binding forkhead associated (FHA) protein
MYELWLRLSIGMIIQMGHLTLSIDSHDQEYIQVDFPAEEGFVVGRSDESSDFIPDIDLAAMNARQLGVSRRHVALVRHKNAPHILDLHSVNGTFLNGRRLLPDVPYALDKNNSVRLGTLQMIINLTY